MKLKTVYICKNCQFQSSKWTANCPNCQNWNCFTEEVINIGKKDTLSKTPRFLNTQKETVSISKNDSIKERIKTDIQEFDRVMGDGIVRGSLILLSGEPGIGKSTLTLQIAAQISKTQKTLIISGEESTDQISLRANRLNINEENLRLLNEFNLENVISVIEKEKPQFIIIDSIQVISSEEIPGTAGSINQVRFCTEKFLEIAKNTSTPILLIGHVTKDGNLAGPKVLEHLVDTVAQLEGDRFHQFRILRTIKNRFGSCNEVGIFEMAQEGLVEVKNPSEQFLAERNENAIGSVITVAMEGTRPFLVEVQALTSTTVFGYPKRTANGFDLNRLQILIAVLEKHARLNLQNQDVFINVVGGIKLNEPAADLAILLAIASSFLKQPLPKTAAVFGEVGLSGELRKVSHSEKREKEAAKLGFNNLISPEKFKAVKQALTLLN